MGRILPGVVGIGALVSLGQMAASEDLPADTSDGVKTGQSMGITIAYALGEAAARINPADPVNWMQPGQIYESQVAVEVEKADEAAHLILMRKTPEFRLWIRIRLLSPRPGWLCKPRKSMTLEKYLPGLWNVKPDFADALFMLSQIEAQTATPYKPFFLWNNNSVTPIGLEFLPARVVAVSE